MAVVCIQLKRGLSSSWVKQNPILSVGEPGFEKDTGRLKIGDGYSHWLELPYLGEDGTGIYNAATHLDFPSVGKSDVIYKAYDEQKLYQWNDNYARYEPLVDISAYATKTYVEEKIVELAEGMNNMVPLTKQEIHDICN